MEETARPITQSPPESTRNYKTTTTFCEFICAGCPCVRRRRRGSAPYVISVAGDEHVGVNPDTRLCETTTRPSDPLATSDDAQPAPVEESVLNLPEPPDKPLTPISANHGDATISRSPARPRITNVARQPPRIETPSESKVTLESGAAPMFMWHFGDEEDSIDNQHSQAD
ncbi:unnamed protein product [Dibothriocephalus latus]|uniref:Uncharacterized protein n=1 Tax=Dibothriocephalus latus TaxID=60516 RepID=A0A3P6TBC9_DIBLA|nr:unnamed protein product [Dibothriocephalus latus]